MIIGYKCFDKGLINRYGIKFEVEKTYHINEEIIFGNHGNGFHVCTNLEDTLRYFDAMNDEVDIALVKCYGKMAKGEDDYYGYYDMYAVELMHIEKILTRKEIINYAIKLPEERLKRFISLFKLSKEEIILFKNKYNKKEQVLEYIKYYQENDKEVFQRRKKI